jgi:hypothetical protein
MFGEGTLFIGLIMAALAFVSLADIARDRQKLFDARLTEDERQRLTRFAAFVLLPLSVLAHEGGHAVMVKVFGGEVVDFGFYLFYGYVGHIGLYTHLELAVIAFAGTFVNVVIGLAVLAFAWYRPLKPERIGLNYLLFVFGALELFNALVFYPVFDAMGGVAGDWQTIYSRDTPVFSALIALNHIALLVGAAVIWRSPRFQAGYAQRIGRRVRVVHTPVTGVPSAQPDANAETANRQREMGGILTVAAATAADGWRHPVQLLTDAQAGGSQVVVRWESNGFNRALLIHAAVGEPAEQRVELHAAIEAPSMNVPPFQRALARIDGTPTVPELIPYILRFLDYIDDWNGATVVSPN